MRPAALAIRLAGARLAHRPRWRIADLAARLADGRDVLTELVAGDRSVGQAFALSYAQVSPAAQRMFRLLGLYPGAEFDALAAAALADVPLPAAEHLVDELVDAHLVNEPDPGRFRFHDLVREYARLLVASRDSDDGRRVALDALLDHYVDTAWAVSALGEPAASRVGVEFPEPRRPDLVEAGLAAGEGWFEANRSSLVAAVHLAEQAGLPRQCWQLARATWHFWFAGGIWTS